MDVSIRDVRYYTCNVIKNVFSLFLLNEKIRFISCRYLFNLKKKKAKYKAHVEASICEASIVEEISTFISYNFKPHLRTRINCVPRYDDSSEMSPILDDPHQKMLSREDICLKENLY
jgi:hypothetical protein